VWAQDDAPHRGRHRRFHSHHSYAQDDAPHRYRMKAPLGDVSDAPDGAPPSGNAKTRSTPSRDDGVERSTLMHMLQVLRCSCSCSCSSHVLMLLLLLPLLRLMA
jgi:hypothetical protein